MEGYIQKEALLFFQAAGAGILLLLGYDLLLALRAVIVHSPALVALEDLLYWICTGFLAFAGLYRANEGRLRSYLFLGVLLGAWLWGSTVNPLAVKLFAGIMGIPVFFAKKMTKRLLFFLKRCKIFLCLVVGKKKAGKKAHCRQRKDQGVLRGAGELGSSKKAAVRKRTRNNYLGMIMIAVIVLVLLGWMLMESRDLRNRLAINNARVSELQLSLENETARTEEIDELKEYMQTDEFAEEVARERLGLVKENEIVFKEEN